VPPICLLVSAVGLAGCGGSGGSGAQSAKRSPRRSSPRTRVARVIAGPAGLLDGAGPQTNGLLWTLGGTTKVRTINQIDVTTGHQVNVVGVSRDARAIAQSATGTLAVGLGAARSGVVEIVNGASGAITGTIPVGAPVISVAFGDDGVTLYALDGTAGDRSVTVINTSTQKIVTTIGLPAGAAGIVPTPNQKALWSVQRSGTVQETSLTNRRPLVSLSTGGPGRAIALSPQGTTLYVLRATRRVSNVAVVSVATEDVSNVLPAAAHSVAIGVSVDGSQLFDFVGSRAVGNIQVVDL
jgi:Tol biopolymer transport system component